MTYNDIILVESYDKLIYQYQGVDINREVLKQLLHDARKIGYIAGRPRGKAITIATPIGDFFIHNKQGVIKIVGDERFIESRQTLLELDQFIDDILAE